MCKTHKTRDDYIEKRAFLVLLLLCILRWNLDDEDQYSSQKEALKDIINLQGKTIRISDFM